MVAPQVVGFDPRKSTPSSDSPEPLEGLPRQAVLLRVRGATAQHLATHRLSVESRRGRIGGLCPGVDCRRDPGIGFINPHTG